MCKWMRKILGKSDSAVIPNAADNKVFKIKEEMYVYYGSFPQKLVTNKIIIRKLKKISNNNNIIEYNNQRYFKVKVDILSKADKMSDVLSRVKVNSDGKIVLEEERKSQKNRRLNINEGTDIIEGQTYFFEFSALKWRIISMNKDEAILVSDSIIHSAYIGERETRYDNSPLREWLNRDFYQCAFNDIEKENILVSTIDNSAFATDVYNGTYTQSGGNTSGFFKNGNWIKGINTEDKVYILSYQELLDKKFGFINSTQGFDQRKKSHTDYSKVSCFIQGYKVIHNTWWTRSPSSEYYGYSGSFSVGENGNLMQFCDKDEDCMGVVPTIKIKTQSFMLEYVDIHEKLEKETCVDRIREVPRNGDPSSYFIESEKYVAFGRYPIDQVKDQALIDKLKGLQGPIIEYSGKQYYRSQIGKSESEYFEMLPIYWKILEETKDSYLLISERILDAVPYSANHSDYKHSKIREFLNRDFLHTAFDSRERDEIIPEKIDNGFFSIKGNNSHNTGEDTQDMIFILSYQDLLKNNYGFAVDNESTTRRKLVTDYSIHKGVFNPKFIFRSHYHYSSTWLTRTQFGPDSALSVDQFGRFVSQLKRLENTGVVPALRIKKCVKPVVLDWEGNSRNEFIFNNQYKHRYY